MQRKKSAKKTKQIDPRDPDPRLDCSLCGKPIDVIGTWRMGHNAQPINSGRCCSKCNSEVVIPVRIMHMVRRFDAGSSR